MTGWTETHDQLRLARSENVGAVTYRRLLRRFGTASAAIAALPRLIETAERVGRRAPRLPPPDQVMRELDALHRIGGTLLVLDGPGYPPLLAMLDDAPPVLGVLGNLAALPSRAVAIVGGRNASANGRRIAEQLGSDLAGAGLCVVSGLARGIDSAAHEGALRTGSTVAAVAGGLDQPYPPENAGLQARIAEGGAVVSEMPPGTQPQSRHFPRRNRIIAGLSLGVVVVEAALRSGSLITVRMAADAGREIFAVPGSPLDPRARGSNDLIRQGAQLTETAGDVVANLPDHPADTGLLGARLFAERPAVWPDPEDGPEEATRSVPGDRSSEASSAMNEVIALLGTAPTPLDELVRRCQVPPSSVMAVILELELAGRVETLPGNRVALIAAAS